MVGRLPQKDQFSSKTAYLYFKGNDVYFRPETVLGKVGPSDENQYVMFGLGFSYDGLRSYHNSISLAKRGVPVDDIEIELKQGKIVTIEIIYNGQSFTEGCIISSGGKKVSIHYTKLESGGYSYESKLPLGHIMRVKLLTLKPVKNEMYWEAIPFDGKEAKNSFAESPFAVLKGRFD